MSKYVKIDIPIKLFFGMCDAYAKLLTKHDLLGVVKLYKVYDNVDKNELEEFLLKYSDTNKKLITNKSKPLIIKVINIDLYDWKVVIYQSHARGINLYFKINNKDLPSEIFKILKPISNALAFTKRIDYLETKLFRENTVSMILNEYDLKVFLKRKPISSEIEKIKYTYALNASALDEYTMMIDSNKQMEDAEKENKNLKIMIDLCEKVAENHDFSLES